MAGVVTSDLTKKCMYRVWRSIRLNPFAPENFGEKRILKLVEQFSGHCYTIRAKSYHKASWSRCKIIHHCSLRSSGMRWWQNFRDQSWLSTFHFLSFPLVSLFLTCVVSFAGDLHVVDFNMVGNVFEKA